MKFGVIEANFGTAPNLARLLQRIGHQALLISKADELESVSALILPGVGSFDTGVEQLHVSGLFEPIKEFAKSGKPTFGVCLGMQLLCESSAEGSLEGLGILPLVVKPVFSSRERPTPHIGWNQVVGIGPLRQAIGDSSGKYFFFSHSYGVPIDPSFTLATTSHDSQFSSIVGLENVIGIQFHPEKSHSNGMQIMSNLIAHVEAPHA